MQSNSQIASFAVGASARQHGWTEQRGPVVIDVHFKVTNRWTIVRMTEKPVRFAIFPHVTNRRSSYLVAIFSWEPAGNAWIAMREPWKVWRNHCWPFPLASLNQYLPPKNPTVEELA